MSETIPYLEIGPWKVIEYKATASPDVTVSFDGTIQFELFYDRRDSPRWHSRRRWQRSTQVDEVHDFAEQLMVDGYPVEFMMHALAAKIKTMVDGDGLGT